MSLLHLQQHHNYKRQHLFDTTPQLSFLFFALEHSAVDCEEACKQSEIKISVLDASRGTQISMIIVKK